MKRFSEQLYKKSEAVKLRASERRELKERIVSYMEYHPIQEKGRTPVPYLTESYRIISIPFSKIARVSSLVAVVMMITLPVAAQRALPGDSLYAIKVQFNEELRSTLAFTPAQKIEWQTELLNRRIAEARLLASEGRLTDEVEEKMAIAVKAHAENANREIAVLRSENEEEATLASLAFNTTLEVQSASLKESSSQNTEAGQEKASRLVTVIDETLQHTESAASSSVPSLQKLTARIEQDTTRAYELLESLSLPEDAKEHANISDRLMEIEKSIAEVMSGVEEDELKTRKGLMELLQRNQRLIVFMTELEASNNVEIEEVVPDVLTEEEEATLKAQYIDNIYKKVSEIDEGLTSSTDPTVTIEVSEGLEKINEIRNKITSSEDFPQIKKWAEEALTLANDMTVLLEESREVNIEAPQEAVDESPTEVIEEQPAEIIKKTTELLLR